MQLTPNTIHFSLPGFGEIRDFHPDFIDIHDPVRRFVHNHEKITLYLTDHDIFTRAVIEPPENMTIL